MVHVTLVQRDFRHQTAAFSEWIPTQGDPIAALRKVTACDRVSFFIGRRGQALVQASA
jgi:hypothetical protein